ncbi:hypothetical protein J2X36_005312 [Methylobacterium sp. BE186]|uniref:hypothetical protein n=1 Tax=Methylobacterium sp. BE186 TaxID=2817715 RepID=UPI002860D07E|nr:hypothetical protein [Methylobacterium sp. BE186]MDR7040529.1 hypothetical protein [Methylobacterium sp. BE186]
MLRRFSSTTHKGSAARHDETEDLILGIRRLVRHSGYERDKIVSALLKQYLPNIGGTAWAGEASLRRDLKAARLDARTIAYLTASAGGELQMAHERSVG